MRVFLKVEMPAAKGNQLARDGLLGKRISEILDELKPEAAYFLDSGGDRAAYLFLDIDSPADIPRIAEPWFLAFEAVVEVHPAMDRADMEKGVAAIESAAARYLA